jgi:hypothetical protein
MCGCPVRREGGGRTYEEYEEYEEYTNPGFL